MMRGSAVVFFLGFASVTHALRTPETRNQSAFNLNHLSGGPVNGTVAFHAVEQNANATISRNAPCQCVPDGHWMATTRTTPKCIFIDLGAANANTLQQFVKNDYGPVAQCPSGGEWEAFVVEANPQFTPDLDAASAQYPGHVHVYSSTAAYSCQGSTSFSIDPDQAHNHWGSSMKRNFGSTMVTVPTVNVMQLIAENVIAADWVMLKVDIEGAEYDLLPCLANFPKANLIDRMYLEEHGYLASGSVYSQQVYEQSKVNLKAMGVDIPQYFSHTM